MRQIAKTTSIPSSRTRDYVALCKPRISLMVLLTVFAGGLVSGLGADLMSVAHAAVGVLLLAASGCAMNQYLERYTDFLMFRTSKRPLPGGRLTATEVALFGSVTFGAGLAYMIATNGWLVAALGVLSWILYVWVYTPLKLYSVFNTMVGAIPGAMPVLVGAAAVENGISINAWMFFAVLVLWQFPHFMSIAWLYRDDYKSGNVKMITVVDSTGFWAGVWAIGFGVLLIPVSILPAYFVQNNFGFWMLALIALLLGIWFLSAAIRFAKIKNDGTARKLLRVSLLYLPLYMTVLVIATLLK